MHRYSSTYAFLIAWRTISYNVICITTLIKYPLKQFPQPSGLLHLFVKQFLQLVLAHTDRRLESSGLLYLFVKQFFQRVQMHSDRRLKSSGLLHLFVKLGLQFGKSLIGGQARRVALPHCLWFEHHCMQPVVKMLWGCLPSQEPRLFFFETIIAFDARKRVVYSGPTSVKRVRQLNSDAPSHWVQYQYSLSWSSFLQYVQYLAPSSERAFRRDFACDMIELI